MIEPEYIAQTFEPRHRISASAKRAWFEGRMKEAYAKGLRFPRFTEETGGLLIEVWRDRWPADQGKPRWQMVAPDD